MQVDLVNLLDLHLLESAKHDDEEESEDEKCESFSLICDGAEDHKRRKIDEGELFLMTLGGIIIDKS